MLQALEIRMSDNKRYLEESETCDKLKSDDSYTDLFTTPLPKINETNVFTWNQDEVGKALEKAIIKDTKVINRVAEETRVEPRLIVSTMFAEQTRMWRTQRGLFKSYLKPLEVLASANQFSLGVMGIKPKTAEVIEKNLTDPASIYYLGADYEHLLDFKTADKNKERYQRLSSEKDHYYSYLYGALCIKQIQKQWHDSGYPIEYRPDIVGTLYNIGFSHSNPKEDPEAGGAIINVNGVKYSYGALSYEFYYSGDLIDFFPYKLEK